MQIRKLKNGDINEVVELGYGTSVKAHSFISESYWSENKAKMATEYLPASETYLAIIENEIIGFVAMVDDFLAAIFVKPQIQGNGIGQQLLNYIKQQRTAIQLKVYKKNLKSIHFYERQGFSLLSEEVEKATGEIECLMKWNKSANRSSQ